MVSPNPKSIVYNEEYFLLYEQYLIQKSREDFWVFRQYLNPKMKLGWFQKEVARSLMQFYQDLEAGLSPWLMIEAPPQHGKSTQIVEFLAWLAGKRPDLKKIYTSYSERLGVRANRTMQRILDSPKYQSIFPNTKLNSKNVVTVSNQYQRNMELLEYVGEVGYFRNTTVRGAIGGEQMDIGICDDLIKGREQAESQTIRDKTWDWFTDDFLTRFSEGGALLGITTRWHVDDPFGRIREKYPNVKVLTFKAIAEEDEQFRKTGEALFPEHKSLAYLLKLKSVLDITSWGSLFQQSPITKTGNWFPEPKRISWADQSFVSIQMWVDPAFGGKNRTAAGIIAKTRDGKTLAKGLSWREHIVNCYPQIISFAKDNNVGTIYVEINKDEGRSCEDLQKLWPSVQGRRSSANKHIKILTRLIQYWNEIFIAEDCSHEFLMRVMAYKEGIDDDEADTLASLLDELGMGKNSLLERFGLQ